jgi:hypothetical protein
MATPTLKRSWGFVGCTSNSSDVGNNFKVGLEKAGPCVAVAGDMLVIGIACPAGLTITITDDGTGGSANTYTQQVTLTGNRLYRIYTCSITTTTGPTVLTFGFGGNHSDIQLYVGLFYNCATASYTDGSAAQTVTPANNTAPNITTGSYSTTVDGDLIFNIVFDDASPPLGLPNAVTSFTWGSGFTGLYAEENQYGSAAQYEVQGTHGAINPGLTFAQATHDQFAALSLAIKAGSGGAAPAAGMYILRSQMVYNVSSAATITTNFPASGNLLAAVNDAGPVGSSLTKITDSQSNGGAGGWTAIVTNGTTDPQAYYAPNASTANAMTVSLQFGSAGGNDLIALYDIHGAATVPLDTAVTAANSSTLTGTSSGATHNGGTQGAAGATLTDAPSMATITSGDLVIGTVQIGNGPASAVNQGSFDYVAATWATTGGSTGDNNGFCNGDGMFHFFPAGSTLAQQWTMNNTVASSWQALAFAFKAAPAASTPAAIDDGDAQQQTFSQRSRMEAQHQQELQDTFGILPTRPPFAFEDDGQNMRWSDWRALQYEEVDIHRALPPIPPVSIEDDAERQKNVTWSAIQYDDTETHRALPPTPPFAIVDEISERPLPGVTPFVEEDQPGVPIIAAPVPKMGLDDIEAHIESLDRVAEYYEEDVFNTALAPPLAQQDEISERTFNWSAPAIEDDSTALPPVPPIAQQEEISERWSGTFAVQFEEDQAGVPIVTSLPPPSIEDDMGQRWSATAIPAIEDDWFASSPTPPLAYEDDLKTFASDTRSFSIEEDFVGKPPIPPIILTASDDEASQIYVDWNLGYARFGAATDEYDSHLLPPIATGPFVLITALRHLTYSALVASGGMRTYSALQASGGMKIVGDS